MTFDAVAREAGFTEVDLRRIQRLGEIPDNKFETVLLPRLHQASDRAERAVINAVWRRLRKSPGLFEQLGIVAPVRLRLPKRKYYHGLLTRIGCLNLWPNFRASNTPWET